MRWEMLEQGSERKRDSTVCIRIVQVSTEGLTANRKVMARSVEDEILTLVNRIREQCFQYAEDFASGISDIRVLKTEKAQDEG